MITLADLPEKQRKEYIGMWCYLYDRICDDFGEPEPPTFEGIIAGYEGDEEAPARVLVRHPDPKAPLLEYEPCYVQPRFDLPRAWSPDGTPDHDRTERDNTTGNLTPHNKDTRPWHPTASNRHYVWYEEHQ